MKYLNIDQYTALNETLESYTNVYLKNSFYRENLKFFLDKIYEIGNSGIERIPVNFENLDYISVNEGIKLICEYLKNLNPKYECDFMEKLTNGTIDFIEADNFKNAIEKTKFRPVVYDETFQHTESDLPSSQNSFQSINIGINKTSYISILSLLHEYIHSIFIKNSDGTISNDTDDDLCEFFAIYFENDFINYLKNKGIFSNDFNLYKMLRYNSIINTINGIFTYQTILLYYKQLYDIIDDYTIEMILKENPIIQSDDIYDICHGINSIESFIPDYRYFLGVPLAHYFSSMKDKIITEKLLSMSGKLDKYTVPQVFHAIGSSVTEIESIDFGNIMLNIKKEVIENKTLKN